jgi:hypothetical protein
MCADKVDESSVTFVYACNSPYGARGGMLNAEWQADLALYAPLVPPKILLSFSQFIRCARIPRL